MYTPIQLDKTRNFKYGMRALHLIEETLKTRMNRLNLEDLSQYELAVILWAGLVHEDSSLTPESVMDLIDEHSSIMDASSAMSKAFEQSFGGGQDGKKSKPRN